MGLRSDFELAHTHLESSVKDAIASAERRLARVEQKASELKASVKDLEKAQAIIEKLTKLEAKCSEAFGDAIRNCEMSLKNIGDTLNLTEEDFRLLERRASACEQ